ncbi:MAG: outer membrane protein [Pseudolabrys sp.]
MNSKLIRTGIAAGAMLALPLAVHAADLRAPSYKAPAYVEPLSASWSGFYGGLNAGYAFGTSDATLASTSATFDPAFQAGAVPSSISLNSNGFMAGGQFGYNYQFWTSWLLGVEADIQYSSIKKDASVDISGVPTFAASTTTVEHKMDWFGTARLRAGYIPWEPLLLYVTGGLAVGQVKDTADIAFPSIAQEYAGSTSKTKFGWTAGAGIEWAFLANWTAKAEYLYYDLGDNTVDLSTVSGTIATASATFPAKGSIGRLGVNYRF